MKAAPVRADQIINRQGKDFCLFAGLVDAAHRSGLRAVRTHLEQAPNEANQHTAIVSASATFVDETGVEYTFSSIGDANAANVGRMIAPHIIRMADTRAVARCFRLALNVGTTAFEELGGESEEDEEQATAPRQMRQPQQRAPQQQRQATQPQRAPQQPAGGAGEDLPASCQPATPQQIASLQKLQVALGRPAVVPEDLNSEQAATQISELVKAFNSQSRTRR